MSTIQGRNRGKFAASERPRTRYHSGLDRWNPEVLSGREICCSVSNCMSHRMDEQGGIWWWYDKEQLWYRMDSAREPLIRAESDFFVAQMRRALPLVRIFAESRFEGEREAAHAAICNLAEQVSEVFRKAPHDGGAKIKATCLYGGLTRKRRWQIQDLDPPEYDEAIEEAFRARDPFWISLRRAFGEAGGESVALRRRLGRQTPGSRPRVTMLKETIP